MLLFCVELYMILALPTIAIIWVALVASKNGDRGKENESGSNISVLLRKVKPNLSDATRRSD